MLNIFHPSGHGAAEVRALMSLHREKLSGKNITVRM
jgi:hypothetical protein